MPSMIDFDKMFADVYRKMRINNKQSVEFDLGDLSPIGISKVESFEREVSFDKVEVGNNQELIYNGERVIVYIRDQTKYVKSWIPIEKMTSNYKYHLYFCQTLESMTKQNKYEKYVVSTRTDGIFEVNFIHDNKEIKVKQKLKVCRHCLEKYINANQNKYKKNYKNMSKAEKEYAERNFNLEEFFVSCQPHFSPKPKNTDKTAPVNKYPDNWEEISEKCKKSAHYTCENCGYYFKDGKGLHTHHKNGRKNDNRPANLQVLCEKCHSALHPHMKKR